ncbi:MULTISPECIES: inositol monophosphatase family protein [unclassified Mycolicibacterium]|uniref:inositol monophosphatase family protein n=1 Tax=unclassified Mycolicibacterium TaxID=2636767 RepID=UPI00130C70CA|nr:MULTISPECIES: inositol monophosphatase family protein [unclassified Mycolicibacterium]MUL80269.1 inositol monophosphatase [Mycolicibacterium sp. CBMA 329]MUL86036.1 inositol monophosphatase [Mycolicibacterium sp. CBMA 331]MUM00810.1 inositol monophosphatase [Mycolicibacterium sp. CBMA 334]MUM28231.1 inositol monophosphatase [Mycolicibacterium sp. CBMA 295]MUM36332.1 inositol monophosphatase [Mycolicibacterium sp. CBMA 247]
MNDNSFDAPALRVVAEQLATDAAEFVARRRAEVFGPVANSTGAPASGAVRAKSTPTDPVTIVDTETERWLRERLAVLRPGEAILGEEEGGQQDGRRGLSWVIDPIDGTVNFVYGIPAYAVSVAVQYDGRSVAGAVANVPAGEVYSAALGHGAQVVRAGVRTPLRCSGVEELSMTLLGTGFAYDPDQRARQAGVLAGVLPSVRDVRRIGSCALDLCMVAAGQLDAYYEEGVQVWDWAAAALIAAEAGATVWLPTAVGAEYVGASAPGIADALHEALAGAGMDL